MNGVNRVAWNTLWIFHCFSRVDRYVTGPSTSLIKKGPSCLGDSFLEWFSSSCCPFHYLDTSSKSCAASASSRARNKDLMRSSVAGVSVLLDTRGGATGVVPYMS